MFDRCPDLSRVPKRQKTSEVRRRQFMKMQVRAVLMLIVTLATMGLAGCGHYNCATSANFGSNNACTPTNSGGGGNGSGIVFSYLLVESGGGASMVADE